MHDNLFLQEVYVLCHMVNRVWSCLTGIMMRGKEKDVDLVRIVSVGD